jgi:hypothetical protein
MPDLASQYTLVTSGGTILFNDYQDDKFNAYGPDEYYVTDIKGLDSPPRRTPTDNAPQTHGGLIHPRLKGPRPVTFEGALMIRSTDVQNEIRVIRNDMEKALLAALDSIEDTAGTLSWVVPLTAGDEARSLDVYVHIPDCEFT